MHIVIDARMIDASGIGVYLSNIINGISSLYKLTLLGDPDKLTKYTECNIIPFYEPIYSIKEQLKYQSVIPECDVFWSPHYNVPLTAIKAKSRIVTIHDVYHLAFGKQLSFVQRLYAKFVIKAAIKLSSSVITVSEFSKAEIVKYTTCNPDKIKVIYNGVNSHTTNTGLTTALIAKYNLPKNYLLFVGNVKPHKNLKVLLQAYLLLSDSLRSEYSIVIVGKKDGFITGDPELFNWIAQTPALKSNVIFTGHVADSDMDAIYHNASLFVFPSLYEGFGLPPLEAMVNNCPVIVSDAACLPEICGQAALYINPINVEDIGQKITNALTNVELRNSLVEQGKEQIKLYSWIKSVEKHINVFNSIVADK